MFDEESNEGLCGTYDMFKSVADVLFKKGDYRKAIDNYTMALTAIPEDRLSYVCRSRCYLKLGDCKAALADAELSLKEDKEYHKGMFQKAEVLFNQGDFEMALVFYHRGYQQRPDLMQFWLGIQKAKEAIINCVGTPDRAKLDTTGDLSFFKTMYEKQPKRKPASQNKKPVEVNKKRKPETSAQKHKTIRQMLGELYGDRQYMERLLVRISGPGENSDAGKEVTRLIEEGLDYLDTRTEFWQQVKPMYARKYEQRQALKSMKLSKPPKATSHEYILAQIERLDGLLVDKNFEAALKRALHVMHVLEGYKESHLSSLYMFMAKVHSVLGNASLELGDYTGAAKHHQTDRDLGMKHNLPDAVSRALDNLGRVYARIGKFHKAIEVWEKKLPLCKTPLESTWLSHELGRCYLEIDKAKTAMEYGERSLAAAQEADDDGWQLHALVLISQAEVKSDHLSSSLISFEIAYEIATLLKDHHAMAAIKKAIDNVNKTISDRHLQLQYEELEMGHMTAQQRANVGAGAHKGSLWSKSRTSNKSKNSIIDPDTSPSMSEDDERVGYSNNYTDPSFSESPSDIEEYSHNHQVSPVEDDNQCDVGQDGEEPPVSLETTEAEVEEEGESVSLPSYLDDDTTGDKSSSQAEPHKYLSANNNSANTNVETDCSEPYDEEENGKDRHC